MSEESDPAVVVYTPLPDGLDEMAPGPALSALLATLDVTGFNGWQLVDVLAAQHRQVSYEQARMLNVVRELAYTPRRGGPMQAPRRDFAQDPFAGTEVAFALSWTDYAAEAFVDVALSTMDRTPAVFQALRAGRLDLAKAKVICVELGATTDEHARQVVDRLLPELGRCTTGQIRDRLRRLLLEVDPGAVRQRHAKAVESRCVQHSEYANGTAAISGVYLPKDKAAAAYDYVDAIAQATKSAGDPLGRDIDQIRAACSPTCSPGWIPAWPGPPPRPHAKG